MKNLKQERRVRRQNRIRSKLSGTSERPRLSVFRSLRKNYAELVNDAERKTLVAVSDTTFLKDGTKTERAKKVGGELAKKALEKGIKSCVFDRRGYKYHGRIKAIAEGAREGGLKF